MDKTEGKVTPKADESEQEASGTRRVAPAEKSQTAALSGTIKDELVLISFLILLVGIISTESYYHVFGIKYQLLSLPSFHVVYRGFTAVLAYPLLVLPYALAAVWLVIESAFADRWPRFQTYRRGVSYLVIVILVALVYPLARRAGAREANADLRANTSTLPTIVALETKGGQKLTAGEDYRLLMVESDFVIVFVPIADEQKQTSPYIKRIPKGEIHVLETVY